MLNSSYCRYFCIYAALTVTSSFLMVVTFFVAVMTYDIRRIKSGRRDCLPCCLAPRPKDGKPAWDEPITQTSNRVMKTWGEFLTFPATKCSVIFISLLLLFAAAASVATSSNYLGRSIGHHALMKHK